MKRTPAQERLLRVLTNPESYAKKVKEVCKLANIPPNTYYRLMKNPDFQAKLRATHIYHFISDLPDILKRILEQAKEGSIQHQKLILELVGFYTPKAQIKVEADIEERQKITYEFFLNQLINAKDQGKLKEDDKVIELKLKNKALEVVRNA